MGAMLAKDKQTNEKVPANDSEILSSPKYICMSSSIITNALKNGSDVMQLPNGDLIVTEYKAVTMLFKWDPIKQKLVKQHNVTSVAVAK